MTLRRTGRRPGIAPTGAAALLAAAALAGCSSGGDRRADVEIRGTDPGAIAAAPAPSAMPAEPVPSAVPGAAQGTLGAPDAEGIVTYDGYQTVVAGGGDTVADLAGRVGLSASELAAYNGLTPGHQMLAGDELVLPPRPGGYGSGTGGTAVAAAAPAPGVPVAAGTIEQAPLSSAGAPAEAGPPPPGGWSPEIAAAAIERSTGLNPDGSLGSPPSSAEPMPPEPEPRRELESPQLNQYQTGAAPSPAPTPRTSPTTPGGRGGAGRRRDARPATAEAGRGAGGDPLQQRRGPPAQ